MKLDSEVKLYNVLKTKLTNVNADWISDYEAALVVHKDSTKATPNSTTLGDLGTDSTDYTNTTIEEIQAAIDRTNVDKTLAAYQTAATSMTKEDIATLKDYTAKYAKGHALEAYANLKVKELQLVRNVLDATKATALTNAINAVAAYDKEEASALKDVNTIKYIKADLTEQTLTPHADEKAELFKGVTINSEYALSSNAADTTYAKELKTQATSSALNVNSVKDVRDAVVTVNNARANGLVEAVKNAATAGVGDATKKTAFYTALKNLGIERVADTNKEATAGYELAGNLTAIKNAATTGSGTGTKEAVQNAIDKINIAEVKAADATKIIEKLNVLGLDNIVVANAAAYVTSARDSSTVGAIGNNSVNSITTLKAAVKKVNDAVLVTAEVKKINEATTVAEVKSALDKLAIEDYVNIPTADKELIAKLVLDEVEAKRKTDGDAYTVTYNEANAGALTTALGTTGNSGILKAYADLKEDLKSTSSITDVVAAVKNLGVEGESAALAEAADAYLDGFTTDAQGSVVEYKTVSASLAAFKALLK